MSKDSELKRIQNGPSEQKVRIAMLELRGEIRKALDIASRKAPTWHPDADRIIVGPCPFPGGKLPKHYKKPLI